MELKEAFLLKSKRQKQAEEQAYINRIFHFGEGHKELVIKRLRELVAEPKTDAELVYAYTCVKDLFTGNKFLDYREGLRQWFEKTYMYPEDKKRIVALALLEAEAGGLDEYPEAEQVEGCAKGWCAKEDASKRQEAYCGY